ncbi:hypothetical protein TW95_gp0111 [Pandoravirus inopinatum]|uniref:Uncharacterized protein n=1 Tax=Pandoravirus inopinatum TaxID=1605721 RepID=A0A0B5J5C4_9VIRU|nr:hypothetical protein TW95_gp0111 [Pandoravirus inopinatum]AJF96845.1 hypothetical protein [Pandoravirus inopinatum]
MSWLTVFLGSFSLPSGWLARRLVGEESNIGQPTMVLCFCPRPIAFLRRQFPFWHFTMLFFLRNFSLENPFLFIIFECHKNLQQERVSRRARPASRHRLAISTFLQRLFFFRQQLVARLGHIRIWRQIGPTHQSGGRLAEARLSFFFLLDGGPVPGQKEIPLFANTKEHGGRCPCASKRFVVGRKKS